MHYALILMLFLLVSITQAAEREIASSDTKLQLLVDENYQCKPTVPITIRTSSAAYYDQDAAIIQRLVINIAGAVLGWECPKVSKLEFFGYTGDELVFRADASKKKKWAMESYPPPLETLALFFGLREPAYSHLGIIGAHLQKYENVPGITETHQHRAFQKQAKRLSAVVDGDTDKFVAYLKNPDQGFKTFSAVKNHFSKILIAVKHHVPEHYRRYQEAYDNVEASLKDAFWSARVASIMEDNDTIAQMLEAAVGAVGEANSADFSTYVDGRIASWIEEDADLIAADLPSSSLYELGMVSDYLSTFPAPSEAKGLSQIEARLKTIPGNLLPLVNNRLTVLQSLAFDTVKNSGSSYADVDAMLETGFAIAEEFEHAGYIDEGERLVVSTLTYIDYVLASGLGDYKQKLAEMTFNSDSVTVLQEQAFIFEELSTQIKGFKAYKAVADKTLEENKITICRSIAHEGGIETDDFEQPVSTLDGPITLIQFACNLFANQRRISAFVPEKEGQYKLEITQSDGEIHRFLLAPNTIGTTEGLTGIKRFGIQKSEMTPEQWGEYLADLLEPLPSGEPDIHGIRECDQLAADPHDANKLARGIDLESAEIDPDKFARAIDACIATVENAPDDARQQYQLGRLLWYAGDQDGAAEFVNTAADAGYAPAIYYKAEMLLGTSDNPDAFIDALALYEAAGKAGYARGTAMVKELNPEGLDFFK